MQNSMPPRDMMALDSVGVLYTTPMGEYRHGTSSRYSKMRSILIIQPNSTRSMTDALKPLVDSLQFKDVHQHHSQQLRSN